MSAPWLTVLATWLPAGWQTALRALVAALLALFLAYWLELETPQSAAVTVMIVSGPVHGMVISKSLYRLGGTLIGGLAAVVLMDYFVQTPQMFILMFGLWMALCTAASTLLRNFRAYGAVLAGYTVALVVFPSIDQPQNLFTFLESRVSAVGLGILCSALVASLTTPRNADRTLERALRGALGKLMAYVDLALSGVADDALVASRRELAAAVSTLDSLVEFASVEHAHLGRISDALRASVVALYGGLTAATSVHGALARRDDGANGADWSELARLRVLLSSLEGAVAKGRGSELADLREELRAMAERVEDNMVSANPSDLSARDRLIDLIDELTLSLVGLIALTGGVVADRLPATSVGVHRDYRLAAINGFRAALLVWIGCTLWLVSGWQDGSMIETMIIPNAGLLAMRDRPDLDTGNFLLGVFAAVGLGWFYLLHVLPAVSGFPLLAVAIAPVLLTAGLLMSRPKTMFLGIGIAVFFMTLLEPANHMKYNPTRFLEMSMASIVGGLLTLVAFRVVLPMDQRGHVRLLIRAILADLATVMSGRGRIRRAAWETRMHERLLRLAGRLRAAGQGQDHLMRGGFAVLRLGRETLRMRTLRAQLTGHPQALAVLDQAMDKLRAVRVAPREAVHAARLASEQLLTLAAAEAGPQSVALARAGAAFNEIALLMGRHRRFLLAGTDMKDSPR